MTVIDDLWSVLDALEREDRHNLIFGLIGALVDRLERECAPPKAIDRPTPRPTPGCLGVDPEDRLVARRPFIDGPTARRLTTVH
jgi:hypothetical protein